jgi:hypothetical protein
VAKLLIPAIDDDESMRLALHTTLHFGGGAARVHMPQTRLSSTIRPAPTARGARPSKRGHVDDRIRTSPAETIN